MPKNYDIIVTERVHYLFDISQLPADLQAQVRSEPDSFETQAALEDWFTNLKPKKRDAACPCVSERTVEAVEQDMVEQEVA